LYGGLRIGGDMNPNPDTNDVLRKLNRDTALLVVLLLGGLISAALAFAVLIPEPHSPWLTPF
jgi:hypothetical protein